MSDVARELSGATPSGPALGFTFDLLLKTLPPALSGLLRLVAIPHEFGPETVRALDPSLDQAEAEASCDRLARLAVVRKLPAALALHDAARQHLFAEWLLPEQSEQFTTVSRRLAELFQDPSSEVFRNRRIFHLIGADSTRGFREFETACSEERRQSRLSECRTLINLVHEYDSILSDAQHATLSYHEGRLAADLCDWDTAALHFTAVTGGPACTTLLRVKADRWMGVVERERRRFTNSINLLTDAVALAKSTPECREEIDDVLRDLAVTYREAGDFAKAETLLKESINHAEATRDRASLAAGLNSLGALYSHRRQYKHAIAVFAKAMNLLEENADLARLAQLKNNLAMAYVDSGDLPHGETLLGESLEIKRAIGDTRGQAVTLGNLADVHARQGHASEAIEACEGSVRAFQSVRDHFAAAIVTRNLGRAFRRARDLEGARQALSRAVDLFGTAGQEDDAVATQREIDRLGVRVRMPLWAWLLVALPVLLIAFVAFVTIFDPGFISPTPRAMQPTVSVPPTDQVRALNADGTTIAGTSEAAGRSAWFSFLAVEGPYVIEAHSASGDTVLLLYAMDGFKFIAADDDGGDAPLASKLEVTLSPGRYYVEVRELDGKSVSFTVRVAAKRE